MTRENNSITKFLYHEGMSYIKADCFVRVYSQLNFSGIAFYTSLVGH